MTLARFRLLPAAADAAMPVCQDLQGCREVRETAAPAGCLAERRIARTQVGEVILGRRETLRVREHGADGANPARRME
jgi:hypothetical protein